MALRSAGSGSEKADGGVYPWLKSGKVGMEEGHRKKGRRVTAVSTVPARQGGTWGDRRHKGSEDKDQEESQEWVQGK